MSLDLSLFEVREAEVWSGNITHNLCEMARAAGLYSVLWRPEERNLVAGDAIAELEKGITLLESYPERFKKFNASNGWGTYEDLLRFAKEVLRACQESPKARMVGSR